MVSATNRDSVPNDLSAGEKAGEDGAKVRRRFLILTVIVFAVLSVSYSLSIPAYEAQDEEHHFIFITHFADRMKLPDFRNPEDLNSAGCQSHQTPLYYFFNGLLLRVAGQRHFAFSFPENPFRSSANPALYLHNRPGETFPYSGTYRIIHLLRLLNVCAGVLILLAVYRVLRLLPFENEVLPVVAMGFVAFIPQFTYLCATLNNDVFSIFFSTLALYFLMKFLLADEASIRYAAAMSIAVGLAVLSKQMTLSFVPPLFLAVLLKGSLRRRVRNGAVFALLLFVIIGWYYLRNWVLFGDLFAVKTVTEVLAPNLVQKKSISQLFVYLPNFFLPIFIESFWGVFGYLTVRLPSMNYLFYNVIAGTGLLACAAGMLDGTFRGRFSKEQKVVLAFMIVVPVFLFAEILSFNLSFSQPQGRYAFNALCCFAVFWGLGMDRLLPAKFSHKKILFLLLLLLFASADLYALHVARRAYPRPPKVLDVLQRKRDVPLGEVLSHDSIAQTFRCNIEDLDTVAVLFTTFGRYNNSHLVFRLKDLSEPSTDIFTRKIATSDLSDNSYYFFTFPALQNSAGRMYLFDIESPDAKRGQGFSCFYTLRDSYREGTASANGRPLPGDLTFITGGLGPKPGSGAGNLIR